MLNLNNTSHILLIVLTCFLFTLCITFYVKKIARHIGAMDMPDARKVHTKPSNPSIKLIIFIQAKTNIIVRG